MNAVMCGDCLELMHGMQAQSVDLVFTSPPYEDCRTYGIDFNLKGQDWVDWLVPIVKESLRICRGLVAFVVAGRTRNYAWTCTPALLIADLYRAGICVRNPPIYYRSGIPGSGGPDWLRSDYEWIVCATHGSKLPWSDNTAMGHDCRYGPGGNPSNRRQNGFRTGTPLLPTGIRVVQNYKPPKLANPGNIINCGCAGGGHIGSQLAHENEAPFPEYLSEFFVRSFCPPEGIVLDPFCGSGTTLAVARKTGRNGIGIDIRQSQVDLTLRRLKEEIS